MRFRFRPFLYIKRFMPKSLFGRSLIILLTPLITVQFILSYIFFERHTDAILGLLAQSIVGDVMMVCDEIERGQDLKIIQTDALKNFGFKVSIDANKTVDRFGSHKDRWLYQYMSEQLNKRLSYLYYLKISDSTIHVEIPHKKGVITIETPRKRLYSRTTPLVIVWTTLSALLLFIVASLFMRNQIRPIRRLADAAEKFGKGIEVNEFRPEGATEVRRAGMAFNIMRDRLRRHIRDRTEMLAGVSHDLRTPLARMKLQLAMMPDSQEVRDLKEDAEQMHKMVQGFLDFSRGVGNEESEDTDVSKLVQKIASDLRHEKLSLEVSCPEGLHWQLKSELFHRCLMNLLSNANKFAENASLQVSATDKFLTIIIEDDGPGVPEVERENVFRPFYRLDTSRNLDAGGVGLGLSIARDVVRSHGGALTLETASLGGLRIVIKIPS